MKNHYTLIIFIYSVSLLNSCFKKDYDSPPDNSGYDPGLTVTHTIAQIQNWPQYAEIKEDIVVQGIVVMDDRSGNYYKKIVIQDTTGGIEILIDQNNLYNDYPVGRKVYLQCKGLFVGTYGQNLQLGYTPDANGNLSSIPFTETDNYIVKANYPNPITADTVALSDLTTPNDAKKYLNTLVVIKSVEFDEASAGVAYAQQANISSATNLNVKDCNGKSITMRNSGFAKFQSYITPSGNGFLTGIYTRYNNTPQIYIRDTADVQFYNPRCDDSGSTGEPAYVISIDSLKSMFNGSEIKLPDLIIRGVVISDRDNGNVSAGNVVLQGNSKDGGIVLYYGGTPNYSLGDSLEINISGGKLKLYNGKLEVDGVNASATKKLASNRKIEPQQLNISDIINNAKKYESTLVMLKDISWQNGAATFNGNSGRLDVYDHTGTIVHYCSIQTTFKDNPLPNSPVTSIVGYIDIYNNTVQIRMRNLNDITP